MTIRHITLEANEKHMTGQLFVNGGEIFADKGGYTLDVILDDNNNVGVTRVVRKDNGSLLFAVSEADGRTRLDIYLTNME